MNLVVEKQKKRKKLLLGRVEPRTNHLSRSCVTTRMRRNLRLRFYSMCTYPHKKGYPHKTRDLKDLYYDVLQFVEKLPN